METQLDSGFFHTHFHAQCTEKLIMLIVASQPEKGGLITFGLALADFVKPILLRKKNRVWQFVKVF